MRIVICWSQISGYMAACWRALARLPDIELFVLAFDAHGRTDTAFADNVVEGIPCHLLSPTEAADVDLIRSIVLEKRPQILVVPGWLHRPYVQLAQELCPTGVKMVLGMDTPLLTGLRYDAKQRINYFRVRHFLRLADRIVVAGERSWQYARFLGAPERKLRRGVYGIDYAALAPALDRRRRTPGGWPRRFIFSGRYQSFKGIDVLLTAYESYRDTCAPGTAWPLTTCGSGPMAYAIAARADAGVTDRGFVQPSALVDVLADHGAFVLASLFDPWPLVIVEAAAAGLPIICTESCGSAVELVRSHYNGITVGSNNVVALAAALKWIADHYDELPEMGARSQAFAAAYAADVWAARWEQMFRQLLA